MAPIAIVVVAALLASAAVYGQQRDYVTCNHQQEVCTCEPTADECYFDLEIEELQTFASYGLENGDIVARGIPGDTYYLDENGFRPSIPNCPGRREGLPECGGPCWSDKFQTLSDFSPNCSMPMTVDGNTYRLFIAVNGRIPGPNIIVTEGQIVIATVTNKLTSEGITIHWHGMHQRGSPWMDGVAFISQGPIVPGAKFDYIFRASPAGTHWYHSHAGAQRTDGLFGALIVKERNLIAIQQQLGVEFEEDDQHTLTLLDWQRESSLNLFVQLHSTLGFYPQNPIGVVPRESPSNSIYTRTRSFDGVEVGPQPYWSGLINGRGRHTSDTPSKLSVFDVSNGKTYRFRLIGAQSLFAYRFSIDGHMLKVIASDGHFIQPRDVHYVIVHTGERYDVLVTANNVISNYWIRAETLETGVNPPHSAEAILHYNGAQDVQDDTTYFNVVSSPWLCIPIFPCSILNCPFRSFSLDQFQDINCIHLTELSALNPSNIPRSVNLTDSTTQVRIFNFGFEGRSSTSAINGRNFRLPVTPYQTYRGSYQQDQSPDSQRTCFQCGPNTSDNQPDCECTYTAEIGENTFNKSSAPTIVFVLSAVGLENNNDFSHPVHLHGHSFNILHIEHGEYDTSGRLIGNTDHITCNNRMCREPRWSNTFSPRSYQNAASGILKDTVIVPAGGYVVIAFQADNPGYWFMHCHIESHQLEGMGVIIREYNESQHNPSPDGINKIGDFFWTAAEFRQLVGMLLGISNVNNPARETANQDNDADIGRILGGVFGSIGVLLLLASLGGFLVCLIQKTCSKNARAGYEITKD